MKTKRKIQEELERQKRRLKAENEFLETLHSEIKKIQNQLLQSDILDYNKIESLSLKIRTYNKQIKSCERMIERYEIIVNSLEETFLNYE